MSQIDTFEAMLARGQDSEMLRYTLGNAYLSEEQYEHAIVHLQKAVVLKPDYSAAWRQLGRALAAANQFKDAKAAFDQGEIVAQANGDKQAAKEINVFRKRVVKALLNAEDNANASDNAKDKDKDNAKDKDKDNAKDNAKDKCKDNTENVSVQRQVEHVDEAPKKAADE